MRDNAGGHSLFRNMSNAMYWECFAGSGVAPINMLRQYKAWIGFCKLVYVEIMSCISLTRESKRYNW